MLTRILHMLYTVVPPQHLTQGHTHTQKTVSTIKNLKHKRYSVSTPPVFLAGERVQDKYIYWGFPLWSSPTRSCRSSTTCWTQSFTSQESVFSTNSGASGFSYSESIPVKPMKGTRWERGVEIETGLFLHCKSLLHQSLYLCCPFWVTGLWYWNFFLGRRFLIKLSFRL